MKEKIVHKVCKITPRWNYFYMMFTRNHGCVQW